MRRIVGLGGGVGASRLWRRLIAATRPEAVTLVVNTADDIWLHGLRVCPDLDTTLYALAGRQDAARGWGQIDETWRCMSALDGLSHDVWFNLGDLDLATHLFRTGRLRQGITLTSITQQLVDAYAIATAVVPMSNDEVATTVVTEGGDHLHYEEFLVKHDARSSVATVQYTGIETARPAPGALEAIEDADVVVIGPSNPVASVGPMLAVDGYRQALARTAAPVIVVSPIVESIAITDAGESKRARSRSALLRAVGIEPSPPGVAGLYADLADVFVIDEHDERHRAEIEGMGLQVVSAPTLFHLGADPQAVVSAILG